MLTTTEQPIRWAILGAGNIARAFATDFAFITNAVLSAVATRDKSKGEQFAAEFGIPRVLTYDELYNDPHIDAIYIATPHTFHLEQSKKALRSKKAVLCEKPITVNVAECRELVQVAREENVFLMEAMWTYFIPALQQARRWVNEGKIGEIRQIQADFGFESTRSVERLWKPELAGGSLLDVGIYPIAFTYFFLGNNLEKIIATAVLSDTGIDEQMNILLQYKNATASLFSSIVCRGSNSATIYGTKGYIKFPSFWRATSIELFDNEDKRLETFTDPRTTRGFHFEMQHVTDCLLEGKTESDIMSLDDSINLQEIMTQARKLVRLDYPADEKKN